MGNPLVRVYQIIAVCVLWRQLHEEIFNDGGYDAPKHAVGNELAHTLTWTKAVTPHIVPNLSSG
jgi:hypothetical protein